MDDAVLAVMRDVSDAAIRRRFSSETTDAVLGVVSTLTTAPPFERAGLIPHATYGGLDQRVERADRLLSALSAGLIPD